MADRAGSRRRGAGRVGRAPGVRAGAVAVACAATLVSVALAALPAKPLFYGQNGQTNLQRCDIDGGNCEAFSTSLATTVAFGRRIFNPANTHYYHTDYLHTSPGGTVRRVAVADGTHEILWQASTDENPQTIDIDFVAGKIYLIVFKNVNPNHLGVYEMDLDGSNVQPIVADLDQTLGDRSRAMALNPTAAEPYLLFIPAEGAKVVKVPLDGSTPTVVYDKTAHDCGTGNGNSHTGPGDLAMIWEDNEVLLWGSTCSTRMNMDTFAVSGYVDFTFSGAVRMSANWGWDQSVTPNKIITEGHNFGGTSATEIVSFDPADPDGTMAVVANTPGGMPDIDFIFTMQEACADANCLACTGDGANDCVACPPDAPLDGGVCVPQMDLAIAANGDANTCTHGSVAVVDIVATPSVVGYSTLTLLELTSSNPAGQDMPFTKQGDTIVLRKSVEPGTYNFKLKGAENGGPISKELDLVGTVTCDGLSAGSGDFTVRVVSNLLGFAGADFTTPSSNNENVDGFAEALAGGLGIEAGDVAFVEAADNGAGDGALVTFDLSVSDATGLAADKTMSLSLDSTAVAGGALARRMLAFEHAARVVSRGLDVCCTATIVEA